MKKLEKPLTRSITGKALVKAIIERISAFNDTETISSNGFNIMKVNKVTGYIEQLKRS